MEEFRLTRTGGAFEEILAHNYGALTLTREQALRLVEARDRALEETGRIEFRGGTLGKIVEAFSDSPYIQQSEYEDTLRELVQLFYACKNEIMDRISDDELIDFMKTEFNGACKGSIELLEGKSADRLIRRLRG